MIADARQIVNHGRSEAARYLDFYGGPIPGNVLCDRISGLVHNYTLYWVVRPFGCSVLIGSYSSEGPQLHALDPSGISYRYFATAIGKGKNGAKSQLEKLDLSTLTAREAVMEAAKIIYMQHDPAKDKPIELEISWVCDETNRMHQLVPPAMLAEATAAAKAAREAMDED